MHVRSIDLVETVLDRIRDQFHPPWLFTLGLYHPKRAELLEEHDVWGADYKGWIFNYVKKAEALELVERDTNPKAALFDVGMTKEVIEAMSEQELRFRCVRNFVSRKVLLPCCDRHHENAHEVNDEAAPPVVLCP